MKHVIRPAARDDILRQFRYYLLEEEAFEVAEEFVSAVNASIESAVSDAENGRAWKVP